MKSLDKDFLDQAQYKHFKLRVLREITLKVFRGKTGESKEKKVHEVCKSEVI